ncbi:MAG TPA: NADH-quinone oxidoreductase subunit NuoB [Candidatus Polarisedimenticolaceae bacterium]|nr:NADH-quinone oxidoreductase subunit NuoB [Candidatus Polarisedimenticolaceae bacterium]
MLKVLVQRLRQGHRTLCFPPEPPELSDRFRGLPQLDAARCAEGCGDCAAACPTDALTLGEGGPHLDLGRCLFCAECAAACTHGALTYGGDFRLAARRRQDLVVEPGRTRELATALDAAARRLFGRSLQLRQVSAGGCNGCEVEVNVLNTVVFDLGRFGIGFVASPRHADGLLVTGPVTRAMREALRASYEAVPAPRLVIAVGACAISGGPYVDHPEVSNGADGIVPVDLYVPGCPPHPATILDGLLRLLGHPEVSRR